MERKLKNPVEALLLQRGGGEKDDHHARRLRLPGFPMHSLGFRTRSTVQLRVGARNEFGSPQVGLYTLKRVHDCLFFRTESELARFI